MLFGGANNDRIKGGSGDDMLDGGSGNDILDGGRGNDIIFGGLGDDRLTGGNNADVFIFEDGDGNDRVTDFGRGYDRIDVTDFGYASQADALATATQQGTDVILTFNGSSTVLLENTDLGQLTEDMFIIV